MSQKIAVIGAGLSGLVFANQLEQSVTIFEKSPAVGGRMATRTTPPWQFDHGAQHIYAKTTEFKQFCETLRDAQILQPWFANFVELDRANILTSRQWSDAFTHYVPVPTMRSLGEYLAGNHQIHASTRVTQCEWRDNHWILRNDDNTLGKFDWLVCAIPPAQAGEILSEYRSILSQYSMKACYALQLGFEDYSAPNWDVALVKNAIISWISHNHSKPGRNTAPSLVVHSSNEWADKHLEQSLDWVSSQLLSELEEILQKKLVPQHLDIQRWRYANCDKRTGEACYVDAQQKLILLGDWFIQGRVESAFCSGLAAANSIKSYL